MSTRGILGFRLDGKDYLTYNHSDSYPSWLGVKVVEFVNKHKNKLDSLKSKVKKLELIDQNVPPALQQVEKCIKQKCLNLDVGGQSLDDWYCLLRNTHGNLDANLKVGFMLDNKDFIKESLFCEWGVYCKFR
jgi:hypothetical protein